MNCTVCQKPFSNLCSACHQVAYCSTRHQKEDWKKHKKFCSPFLILETENLLGKSWVAARDLKPGSILLDEIPATHGPRWSTYDHPSCLTCGVEMDDSRRCSTCHWPLCSEECEKMAIHAENECQIFSLKKIKFPPLFPLPLTHFQLTPFDTSLAILMLRGVALKKKNGEIWTELMNLQAKRSIPYSTEGEKEFEENVKKYRNWLGVTDDETHEQMDCSQLLRVSKVNGFGVQLLEENDQHDKLRTRTALYLYQKASRLNHSCSANCTWSIGQLPDFKIRIRTSLPIKKGEALTISYYAEQSYASTLRRQRAMRDGAGFICKCQRCLDPTEMGTFACALICSDCKEDEEAPIGYLLPQDPLDTFEDSLWQCDQCHLQRSASQVIPPVEKIGKMIRHQDKIVENKLNGKFETFCLSIIEKYSGHSMHVNHWILQDAARAIVRFQTPMVPTLDQRGLQKYVELNEYLLEIQNLIFPGISFNRASIQRNIVSALVEMIERFVTQIPMEELQNLLRQSKKHLDEALAFYLTDLPERGQTKSFTAQGLLRDVHFVNGMTRDLKIL